MKFNYMDRNNKILTSVRMDNKTKKITFQNYTDNIINRVFGVRKNGEATYEDLMDFFKERTFPENVSDLDNVLKILGLKKYDPYLMCKKRQGRTPRDHNWIDFIED